ncbi:MafI family immunity protein [Providencia rettgeri]|uniref:MafI family immunity protein n=1 Tax=Providencia rettgeri TaxID=587 RepID=UPI000D7EA310|nr:MafI family immunity protein [Providencia rettgeri]AWS50742.1 hypothetical protein AM461_07910 [Providencia rettgeri]EMA4781803.1 MafI family immunity protein [Providencia rettgeri]
MVKVTVPQNVQVEQKTEFYLNNQNDEAKENFRNNCCKVSSLSTDNITERNLKGNSVSMNVSNEIKRLCKVLEWRLDSSMIDYYLECVDSGEPAIAIESICDSIANNDIKITKNEYVKIIDIANELGIEINNRFLYINPEKSV